MDAEPVVRPGLRAGVAEQVGQPFLAVGGDRREDSGTASASTTGSSVETCPAASNRRSVGYREPKLKARRVPRVAVSRLRSS
jgi:hypothetical protein